MIGEKSFCNYNSVIGEHLKKPAARKESSMQDSGSSVKGSVGAE